MTSADVTYVLARETCDESSASLVARLDGILTASVAVHVCRLARAGSPSDIRDRALRGSTSASVSESWLVGAGWLRSAVDEALDAAVAARTIVRVDWPVVVDDELTLLEARLRYPELRVAVTVAPDDGEDAYHYFDRLGLSWIVVPALGTVAERAAVLARLARAWLLDPRSHTVLEPTASAFAEVIRERIGDRAPRWRYRVVDEHASVLAAGAWCSTIHAALQARALAVVTQPQLDHLVAVHDAWTTGLARFSAAITPALLDASATPVA